MLIPLINTTSYSFHYQYNDNSKQNFFSIPLSLRKYSYPNKETRVLFFSSVPPSVPAGDRQREDSSRDVMKTRQPSALVRPLVNHSTAYLYSRVLIIFSSRIILSSRHFPFSGGNIKRMEFAEDITCSGRSWCLNGTPHTSLAPTANFEDVFNLLSAFWVADLKFRAAGIERRARTAYS